MSQRHPVPQEFFYALAAYWDAAWKEGRENRMHDDEAGTAQKALGAVRDSLDLYAQQVRREALEEAAKVCDVTPPYPFRPSIEAAHAIRLLLNPMTAGRT